VNERKDQDHLLAGWFAAAKENWAWLAKNLHQKDSKENLSSKKENQFVAALFSN